MLDAKDADDYGLERGWDHKHGCIEPGLVLSNSFGFGHFLFFSRSLVTEDEIRDGGHRGKVEYVIKL